jgi:hypothetical protein
MRLTPDTFTKRSNDMLKLVAGSIARQVGSAAAGWLVGHGLAEQAQATDITTIIAGVFIYLLAQGWSLLHKSGKVSA